MGSAVSFALEMFLAVLAPPRCAACDTSVRLLAVFCPECARTAVAASAPDLASTPGLAAALPAAALVYGGAIARAIVRMKYESRPDLARPLGDLLWRAIEPHAASLRDTLVIPVPLHPSRLAERGFNQSALLARRVAGHLGAAFEPRALIRTRETEQQASLDRTARIQNVAGAFRARARSKSRPGIGGRRVLLVDDVATTGATLDACEQALHEGSVAHVDRLVLASAPHRVEESVRRPREERQHFGGHGSIMPPDP